MQSRITGFRPHIFPPSSRSYQSHTIPTRCGTPSFERRCSIVSEYLRRVFHTIFLPSASSKALPAPNPSPTHAGHALRLNNRTEKTTPKDRPRDERMRKEEIAWSHYNRVKFWLEEKQSRGFNHQWYVRRFRGQHSETTCLHEQP